MKDRLLILNIEDNPNDTELIREALAEVSIENETVRIETLEDLLAAVEKGGFDIILCDNSLPSFDGLSALSLARGNCPDVPYEMSGFF